VSYSVRKISLHQSPKDTQRDVEEMKTNSSTVVVVVVTAAAAVVKAGVVCW